MNKWKREAEDFIRWFGVGMICGLAFILILLEYCSRVGNLW